jgi:NDP-sugar pyrophosphorylase family protein
MLPFVILAGGVAQRLRPLTETIPKALVEIAGEPFIAHQLRLLARAGAGRAIFCIGYLGEQIRDYVGDGGRFGVRAEYVFDGPTLRGTAGAIGNALETLDDAPEAFFTIYGDSYLPCDYAGAERAFLESGRSGLMTVHRNEGRWDSSNVEFDGERIVVYDKRNRTPAMRYIDYGLGAFRREVFARLPAVYDLATLYQDLLARGDLAAHQVPERFYEIGSFAGIQELTELLAK